MFQTFANVESGDMVNRFPDEFGAEYRHFRDLHNNLEVRKTHPSGVNLQSTMLAISKSCHKVISK